jgi:Uma2 family endonuclease
VLSPDDRPSEVRGKTTEYIEKGVPLVVVIDPEDSTVTVFRPAGPPTILRAENDLLDLSDVIRGFHCSLREIFE